MYFYIVPPSLRPDIIFFQKLPKSEFGLGGLFYLLVDFLVDCALCDKAGHFLGGWRGTVKHLVTLHVLFATETFSTNVAKVKVGCVASFVDQQIVRL